MLRKILLLPLTESFLLNQAGEQHRSKKVRDSFMRFHSSTIVMLLVTAAFVGSSIGCRSNGGPWYNPKSYTWTKPFENKPGYPENKRNEAALANTKPSLGSQPSVSAPPSGYTAGNYSAANKEDARFHQTGDTLPPSAYSTPQAPDSSKLASAAAPSPAGTNYYGESAAPAGSPNNYTYNPGNPVAQTSAANYYPPANSPAYQPTSAQVPAAYPPNSGYNAAPVPVDNGNYAPFAAPGENASVYAAQQQAPAAPYYGNQAPAQQPAAGVYGNSNAPVYQPPVANGY
ncbi:MAG: hypothetical protein LBT89_02435 [Planctomycetaceae bacterium]|jgi:hypothetical protein|nr:hypothetical protein [Planctomycetaceae bacterium]